MLFLTFLFPYHVVNAQKYIITTLTNARAIHSHSPLLLPVKPMTSRLIARFPNIRTIAVINLIVGPTISRSYLIAISNKVNSLTRTACKHSIKKKTVVNPTLKTVSHRFSIEALKH